MGTTSYLKDAKIKIMDNHWMNMLRAAGVHTAREYLPTVYLRYAYMMQSPLPLAFGLDMT